jgi:Fic family protein
MKKVASPPNFNTLFDKYGGDLPVLLNLPPLTESGKYAHWDEVRHLKPPNNLSLEQWWLGMKLARSFGTKSLPMVDAHGHRFTYYLTPSAFQSLHLVDSRAAGRIAMPKEVSESGPKERFLVRSLIEEAITSSQLEGASTTRKAAMEMFRSGRQPSNKAERMIFNNLRGMQFIQQHKNDELTPELVLEIHRHMTEGTLPDDAVGRIQTPNDERIGVYSNTTQEQLHEPPPAHLLPKRMRAMCDFANRAGEKDFMHPVVRAILLHFWLAYDHPFEDGNGRTARALFYWSMLRQGYWLFEFISISSILKKAQAKYGRSFQYTETDDNDATYFINFQLEVIDRALDAVDKYLARKTREIADAERRLKECGEFNYRQLALLSHALRKPATEYTVKSHSVSHNVTAATARTDLHNLVEAGLLEERRPKSGRKVIYAVSPNLAKLL